ncbi:phosphotransferase [soil metagenome]
MAEHDSLVTELVAELPAWLPTQRWFAGKDRPISAVRALSAVTLVEGDPLMLHVLVEVEQGDRKDVYQLLVGDRKAQAADVAASSFIGLDTGLNCYEASGDADLASQLLDFIAAGDTIGPLTFEAEPGAELIRKLRARPITSEQSNTSLVFGSKYILKLFRRLEPGLNKDLLLHRALHDVGCAHIAQPLGSITGELSGETVTIGMLQKFFPDAVDGWAMATTSVRDLMADPGVPLDELGGDFAGEASRLGAAVATVHKDLVRALGKEEAGPADLDRSVDSMVERLDRVVSQVPELGDYAPTLRAAFENVRGSNQTISMQYIHGDLHLGQVLRTVSGWLLLDFEGEPASPVAERVALRSPLRDVAGMLRSFDYAAHQLLIGNDDPQLADRAMGWAQRNRDAFCDGYAATATGGVGDPRDQADLLRALELDKAVYEVSYEYANRPEWLTVPLASIARITTEGA